LLATATSPAGEVYAVEPSASQLANAPQRMFAFRALGAGDYASARLPVPQEGYYALRSQALWGPWAEGRLGRFEASADGVVFPGVLQGWYGLPTNPPFQLRDHLWGVAHFTPPEAEVRLALTHSGQGNLLAIGDLRLEPVKDESVQPADKERKVAAAPQRKRAVITEARPTCDIKWQRGLEWTAFIHCVQRVPQIDGVLADWKDISAERISINASIIPHRGWVAPSPASDADLSGSVWLSWDATSLYLAAEIKDDDLMAPAESGKWGSPFGHDSLVVNVKSPPWLTSGGRSSGLGPADAGFGLSFYAKGQSPRPLGDTARYVARRTKTGYTIEASLPFGLLGWKPADVGDRFPLGLILVDIDPSKPGGERFDQYGWNFGPGSWAGMGEVRLIDKVGAAAGELIPASDTLLPSGLLQYVGSVDVSAPCTLKSIQVVRKATGAVAATHELNQKLDKPGRYSIVGQIPLPGLGEGEYHLRLVM